MYLNWLKQRSARLLKSRNNINRLTPNEFTSRSEAFKN
jgi:hypothetical protein